MIRRLAQAGRLVPHPLPKAIRDLDRRRQEILREVKRVTGVATPHLFQSSPGQEALARQTGGD